MNAVYCRQLRKTIHILAGFPAFLLPHVSYSLAVAGAIAAFVAALLLRPNMPWLRAIAKPEDYNSRSIGGVRHYFATVLMLIALFGARHPELVMAGWLALAWGDGAAGIAGSKAGYKLPWANRKTALGFAACCLFVWLAANAAFFAAGASGAWTTPAGQGFLVATAVMVAFLESWSLPFDDNYSVGLGTAILLYAGKLMFSIC